MVDEPEDLLAIFDNDGVLVDSFDFHEQAWLELERPTRLIASDIESLRLHYAYTLLHWLDRTEKARKRIVEMYDERFFRMWEFYLAGGIVMFENGAACNYQVQYIRERTALPITRDYMLETEERYRKIAQNSAPAKKAPARRRRTEQPEFAK